MFQPRGAECKTRHASLIAALRPSSEYWYKKQSNCGQGVCNDYRLTCSRGTLDKPRFGNRQSGLEGLVVEAQGFEQLHGRRKAAGGAARRIVSQ